MPVSRFNRACIILCSYATMRTRALQPHCSRDKSQLGSKSHVNERAKGIEKQDDDGHHKHVSPWKDGSGKQVIVVDALGCPPSTDLRYKHATLELI